VSCVSLFVVHWPFFHISFIWVPRRVSSSISFPYCCCPDLVCAACPTSETSTPPETEKPSSKGRPFLAPPSPRQFPFPIAHKNLWPTNKFPRPLVGWTLRVWISLNTSQFSPPFLLGFFQSHDTIFSLHFPPPLAGDSPFSSDSPLFPTTLQQFRPSPCADCLKFFL